MKMFKDHIIERISNVLEIYGPYKGVLSESDTKDVKILEHALEILRDGNIPDLSDLQKKELPIYEEQAVI